MLLDRLIGYASTPTLDRQTDVIYTYIISTTYTYSPGPPHHTRGSFDGCGRVREATIGRLALKKPHPHLFL
jgi:hypothetical protein